MTISPTILAQAAHVYGFEGTTSQAIFVAGFSALVVVAVFYLKIRLIHWLIAGMLFATALTAPLRSDGSGYLYLWLHNVQVQRANLHMFFGILLTLAVLPRAGEFAGRISFQSVFMLAIQFYSVFIRLIHDDLQNATETLVFALGVIPCMMLAAPMACDSYEGCVQTIQSMMWVSVLWTFGASVQFVIDPQKLVATNGRFWGLLANPNQAGQFCGPLAVFALWMMLNDTRKRIKPMWAALLGINLLFTIWSGSRNSGVMFVIGMAACLYGRGGRAVFLLPFAAMLAWGLYELSMALEIQSNLERFAGGGPDSRSHAWANQIGVAMDNPILGAGTEIDINSESSYLLGFAMFGIGMLLLLLAFWGASMFFCARLALSRRLLAPRDRTLMDLFIGFNTFYFISGIFEGSLLGRSSTIPSMMLIMAGIGVYLKRQVAAVHDGRAEAYLDDEAHRAEDEPEYGDDPDAHPHPV